MQHSLKKVTPSFPPNSISKLRSCQAPPFWKFGWRFTPPPPCPPACPHSRKEGVHYVHNLYCFHEWDVFLIDLFMIDTKIKKHISLESWVFAACTINLGGQLICLHANSLHECNWVGLIDKPALKSKVQ